MSTTAVATEPCRDAAAERRPRSIVVNTPATGMIWFGGWLFTIGFAQLGFWKAVLGLCIWPYYLGALVH